MYHDRELADAAARKSGAATTGVTGAKAATADTKSADKAAVGTKAASKSARGPKHFVPAGAAALDCAIIVPTYNEAGNVGMLAKAVAAALEDWAYEIIFVDDWSQDGTPDVVAAMAQADPRIRLIRRFGRRGLSSAVLEGMLASVAPLVAVIDADMQHDEKVLPQLLEALRGGGADVAIGSRYCDNGSVGNWGGTREAGSRWATKLSHLALKAPLSDPMSGFFAVRRDVMLSARVDSALLGRLEREGVVV